MDLHNQRPMFKHIRVQILYPCRAQCSWCATHPKNPLFSRLYKEGISERVHNFYVEQINRLRPQQVFISGGEPLLYPEIASFLNDIQDATGQINLFTSYQFSKRERQYIPFDQMPWKKILLPLSKILLISLSSVMTKYAVSSSSRPLLIKPSPLPESWDVSKTRLGLYSNTIASGLPSVSQTA